MRATKLMISSDPEKTRSAPRPESDLDQDQNEYGVTHGALNPVGQGEAFLRRIECNG
jgi:hypothetical protein